MTPLIPLGAAALVALAFFATGKPANPAPVAPPDVPPAPPPPAPPSPVAPDNLLDSVAAGTVNAPSGLNLRTGPSETSASNGSVPFNAWVGLLSTTPDPATAAAPAGWFHVKTTDGRTGFVTAEWIVFGTPKERGMTPAEEQAYHESHQDFPMPDYAPVETSGIVGRALSAAPRTRGPRSQALGNVAASLARGRVRTGAAPSKPLGGLNGGHFAAPTMPATPGTSTFHRRPGGFFPSPSPRPFYPPRRPGGYPWFTPAQTEYILVQNVGTIARCALTGGCPMQSKPEANATTFATLPQGAVVNVIQRVPGWAWTRWYGPKGAQYGWVPSGALA